MKFDSRTLQILKNFSTINPSIQFKPGKTLSTISTGKTIMARAKIAQDISGQFAIYDLSRFLGTISLFSDPELDVQEKFMEIREGQRKLNYTFTEPSLIVTPPDKDIKLPDPEVKFSLDATDLQEVLKALAVLSLPEIAVVGDGESITVQAIDSKNPSGDVYSVKVGDTTNVFRMIIRADNLKLLPGAYEVEISAKGLSKFTGAEVEYFVAVESNSTFEG
jgi:hypothetical protein